VILPPEAVQRSGHDKMRSGADKRGSFNHVIDPHLVTFSISLPYLTLPYGKDVLPPSAEASNGPNAHPRINRKVTKSPSAILTWIHTNTWNHASPSLEGAYSLEPTY